MTNLKGKHVLVRVPFDVSIQEGKVGGNFRIARSMPTIVHLIHEGAKVILLSHIGRDPKNTFAPLLPILRGYLDVAYVPALTGAMVTGAITEMKDGEIILLENLRTEKGEEENDDAFACELAEYGDYYVNDAFSASHRRHASIVGISKYLPSFAGIAFMEEFRELSRAFVPEVPSLFIIGGAKFETKEPLIDERSDDYSKVFVGGALANDFLKAKGYSVGESLLSDVSLEGNTLIERENIITPIDVVVLGNNGKREILIEHVMPDEKILDVGPRSMDALEQLIKEAKTILWNGPLGNYEAGFDDATKRCAEMIAKSSAHSVVGGGDTVTAIEELGIMDSFDFVSTGGGAMLDFLEHRTLPGIKALVRK